MEPSDLAESINVVDNDIASWQNKMLPSMQRMIIGLAIFFFLATLCQLAYLQYVVLSFPKLDLSETLVYLTPNEKSTFQERKEAVILKSQILLENNTLARRHHHAYITLMSSMWVRYLAFVTGMILALIGAIFILGKLQVERSVVGASIYSANLSIKSSSPGIILAVMGTCLMIMTIVMQHTVSVNDAPVYLEPGTVSLTPKGPKVVFPLDSIK
ncbi:hypothetical protein [Mucilaginibacter lappiensis]|jgi:hypothetical protein|uniref:hypothetical protein n=1 Tax=Mucilaginibacter lappiensis TaxID=354630 RepID=UPI003D1E970C